MVGGINNGEGFLLCRAIKNEVNLEVFLVTVKLKDNTLTLVFLVQKVRYQL